MVASAIGDPLPASGPKSSAWVERYLPGVRPGGTVVDIACGSGRHVRLALARGYRGVGVDRDLVGVMDLAGHDRVELLQCDLEALGPFPLHGRRFEGVIVTKYLWRPILPSILASVSADGVLIYETFAVAHARFGGRPSNPDFLLKSNELIDWLSAKLTVIAFEQARVGHERPMIVQRIVAVGPAHHWVDNPPPSLMD